MKKLGLFLALLTIFGLSGCASFQSIDKNIKNQVGGGLFRRVTFYSLDGKVLKTWEGKVFTESDEGQALHFQVNGKRMTLSGTYSIEEL